MRDRSEERMAIIAGDFDVTTPGIGQAIKSRVSWKPGEDPKQKEAKRGKSKTVKRKKKGVGQEGNKD